MKPVHAFENFPEFANAGVRSAPENAKYATGFVAADTLPAEWANYFFHGSTKGISDLNGATYSIWQELQAVLTAYDIEPSAADSAQLLAALRKREPQICSCASAANDSVKSVSLAGNVLRAGNIYAITMSNANTYGDGETTYPQLQFNGGAAYPLCNASGHFLTSGAWTAGDIITVLFTGEKYLMATPPFDNEYILQDVVNLRGGIMTSNPRFLRFSAENKKALVIKANTVISVGANMFAPKADVVFDLSEQITDAGKDYFVYLNNNAGAWSLTASTTKAADTDTSRYIGRFHTLCASVASTTTMTAPAAPSSGIAVGDSYLVKSYDADTDPDFFDFYNKTVSAITVQTYYDVVTCAHPLAGFSAGDILPESVWCLTFKPDCKYDDAMVYDKDTGIAVDVYLQSGKGSATRSKYNATHTVTRPQICHADDMRQVGKRLLSDDEFTSIALGSNEKTNIVGSSDKSTVGGHSDTAGRRMISAIGCEECCGYLWQWLRDVAALGTGTAWTNIDNASGHNVGNSGWISEDGHNSFGQMYNAITCLLAGGSWYHASDCGSRCRYARTARSSVSASFGSRGSSRVVMR